MAEAFFSPNPEAPALVIGGAGVDLIGWLKAELQMHTSNPAQIRASFGGVARNIAENLAHLGQPVRLITAVGEDHPAAQLVGQLIEAGVDTSAILHTLLHPTGAYVGVISPGGALQFAMDDMRAISALTPGYIRERADLFKESSLVFMDANLPKDTMRTVISLARKADLPVCADPTSASLAPRLLPHLHRLSLITPNSAEASILCEQTFEPSRRQQAIDAAKCLVNQGVGIAVITLAEIGVCYATAETSGYLPAIRTQIVDPTGAGDALTATVLFGLLNEMPLDDAVRLGVSAASLTLRQPGSVVPDLSLEKLYEHLVI